MTVQDILSELAQMGSENTKKIFMRHGAIEPIYGVKVGDLKTIQKIIKKDYQLALDLYATGNSDAMYLAGLIADEKKMTKADLQRWIEQATWHMLSEYTVAWITAESRFGAELAREWIESDNEKIAAAGWSTWSNVVSIKPDNELDINELSLLLDRVQRDIHSSQNRVRYAMNGFVIAVGSYVAALTEKSFSVADNIGKVSVDMRGTSCNVPLASDYLDKILAMNKIGKKKKMARC